MKIISWNVNGLKSIIENPDILCFQEVKSTEIPEIEGYYSFNNPCSTMPNFYETAIYSKIEPISIKSRFNDREFDRE